MRRSGLLATVGIVAALSGLCALPASAGAASANTAALQVALRAMRLYSGRIDGVTGPLTRRGTRRFQRRRGLAVDGFAGRRTRRALGRRGRPRLGSRPLSRGRRGWDVAGLQFLLNQRGFGPGGFDGGFGPRTSRAVRRFQRAAGLSVDGVAGASTLRALRRRTLSGSRSPRGPVRFLRPVDAAIGDRFGAPRPGGRRHTGIDMLAGYGTPVGAGGRGVVTYAEYNSGGYGNLVIVKHRLGFESWYAHLSRISVSPGDRVVGGSRLGYVGSTGNSTGPHLHFEVRRYGTPVNPVPYLLRAVARRASAAAGGRFVCRPNADAWGSRDADPAFARIDRCP